MLKAFLKINKNFEKPLFLLFLFLVYSKDTDGMKGEVLTEIIKQKEGSFHITFLSQTFENVIAQFLSIPTLVQLRRKKYDSIEENHFY